MKYSLFFKTDAAVLCFILFVGCILMVVVGKFVRTRLFKVDDQESRGGVNSLLGALFGLWGFILAFTFGNSASRFETVRSVMVEESNLIRSAILRTETFPDTIRNGLREDLRNYLEARINYYQFATDFEKFNIAKTDAEKISRKLWTRTVSALYLPNLGITTNNMLTTLNNMFDIASRRDAVLMGGTPELIMYMLFFLALAISFIGGFTSPILKTKEWIVIAGFVLLACVIIYITLDLGRPLRGLIKPDVGEDKIVHLRKMF